MSRATQGLPFLIQNVIAKIGKLNDGRFRLQVGRLTLGQPSLKKPFDVSCHVPQPAIEALG